VKLKLLLLINCFFVSHLSSFCNPPETLLLFSVTSSKVARLGVINTTQQSLSVQIVKSDGDIYFNETIKEKSNLFQLLEMNKLPDGEYCVRVTGTDKVIKREFIKSQANVEVLEVFEPKFFNINNEMVNVFYKNPKGAPVNITIEQKDEVLFSDGPLTDKQINKRYSLQKFPKGVYIMKFNVSGDTYQFTLDIKK
jgi:hypothetical protein